MNSILHHKLIPDDEALGIHEVKNAIAAVRGLLQFLKGKEEWWAYNEYYDLMIEEISQADSIINRLLTLVKESFSDMERKNLKRIVESVFPIIQADAWLNNRFVRLELGEVPDLPLDESDIRRLIINLARNGLEAAPPESGIVIKTFIKNGQAVLAVQDFGAGIDEIVLGRMGTLFFTTKEDGNGLGLAICHKIVEKHNALMEVNTSSSGTTFLIYFPIR